MQELRSHFCGVLKPSFATSRGVQYICNSNSYYFLWWYCILALLLVIGAWGCWAQEAHKSTQLPSTSAMMQWWEKYSTYIARISKPECCNWALAVSSGHNSERRVCSSGPASAERGREDGAQRIEQRRVSRSSNWAGGLLLCCAHFPGPTVLCPAAASNHIHSSSSSSCCSLLSTHS